MLDVPELDILICRQLDRHDLAQCLQVCKKWSKTIHPYLWHDLSGVSFEQFYHLWMSDYLFTRNRSPKAVSGASGNNTKTSSTNNNVAGTDTVEAPLLSKYGHLVQILPCPVTLLQLLSRAKSERETWRDLQGLTAPSSPSSIKSSGSGRPPTARRGSAYPAAFAVRGCSSACGAGPETSGRGTAGRARASRGSGKGTSRGGGGGRGSKAVPSLPFYLSQAIISMESYPNDSRMLVHLLKVRCPNAVKNQQQLTICSDIVESSAHNLLMQLYVPHAKSIVFENGEWSPVTIKLPVVKSILGLCEEPLERLVFNLRMIEHRKKWGPRFAWKEESEPETSDSLDSDFGDEGNESGDKTAATNSTDNKALVETYSDSDNGEQTEDVDDDQSDEEEECPRFILKSLEFKGYSGPFSSTWLWEELEPNCQGRLQHLHLCSEAVIKTLLEQEESFLQGMLPYLKSINFDGGDKYKNLTLADPLVSKVLWYDRDEPLVYADDGEVPAEWEQVVFGYNISVPERARCLLTPESFVLDEFRDSDLDENLVQILRLQHRLKTFELADTSESPRFYGDQQKFRASVFADYQDAVLKTLRPWPCTATLTFLQIRVSGIPRPDLPEDCCFEWTPEEYPGQGRLLQRQVCERLGTLVNLERLWLGINPTFKFHPNVYIRPKRDGLELTLETGLKSLKDLKKLREINVRSTEHRMGDEEVRWMKENWPLLQTIHGLEREDGLNEEDNPLRGDSEHDLDL